MGIQKRGIGILPVRQRNESGEDIPPAMEALDDRQDAYPTEIPKLLGEYSHISMFAGLIGAFYFAHHQTGLSTGIAAAMSIGLLMLVYVQANYRKGVRVWVDLFTASTAAVVAVSVSELLTRFDFCPSWQGLRFWLI